MLDFVAKHFGWIATIVLGAVSWLVYFVRTLDGIKQLQARVDSWEKHFREEKDCFQSQVDKLHDDMRELQFEMKNQKEKVTDLGESTKELKEQVSKMNTHLEVIAAWAKMQGGNTVILRKD